MKNLKDIFNNAFQFLKLKKNVVSNNGETIKEKHSLKNDSIRKLLFAFVGPAVLGLLINALYNFVDRIFVGQFVGADGLSAVTIVFPFTLMQFGLILLFGSGAGILIAKSLGESNIEQAQRTLGNAIAGLLLIMVIFTVLGLSFYEPILVQLGATGELLQLSSAYMLVIVLGFPLSFFLALEFTCRAEGNPKLPAMLIIFSCIINVSLDYIFMKIYDLGIQGAALATIIAQAFNALFLLGHYVSGRSSVQILRKNIRLNKHIILPILLVGTAPFLMDLAISLQNVFVNRLLLLSGGIDGVAAMGILFGINVFFMMTALGTGDGMQPIISFNYGAKQYDRITKTLTLALKWVLFVAFVGVFILELFPLQLSEIFVEGDNSVIAMSKTALQIFAISIPFYMVQVVITRYFQALEWNRTATFLALLRPIILFIPISYFLSIQYGLKGIWAAFPISDGLAVIISLRLLKKQS